MRGVPVRVEIGPRDVEQGTVVLARRDLPGKQGKQPGIPLDGVAPAVRDLLAAVQRELLRQATAFRDANTTVGVRSYAEFREVLEDRGGFIRTHWAGTNEDELRLKDETKATIRCFPLDAEEDEGMCFFTGARTRQVAVFARAY
jgi:prolyl-tRNA synthetase